MRLTDVQLADIHRAAEARQPAEMCGVIADGRFIEIRNQVDTVGHFIMDPRDYIAKTKGLKVEAIVHSHVYEQPLASDADRTGCEQTGVPWVIFSWPNATYSVVEPCGYMAPLVGRNWAHGTHDCYGLLVDAFKSYAGLVLPHFDRSVEWWKHGGNIIAEQFAQAGFEQVSDDPRHLDVMVMQIRSPVPNHIGIFLQPDVILHQLSGRLSRRDVYGGMFATSTVLHLRHKELAGG